MEATLVPAGKSCQIGIGPCIGHLLKTYRVSYMFYPDQVLDAGPPRISMATLRDIRHFRQVFQRGDAHVFLIIAPDLAARHQRPDDRVPRDSIANAN